MLFTIAKKVADVWATVVRKIVPKNFKKSPNLVTLLPTLEIECFYHRKIAVNVFTELFV